MVPKGIIHKQQKLRAFFIISHCHDGELELAYALSSRADVSSVTLVIPSAQQHRVRTEKKLNIHTFHFESFSVKRLLPWIIHSNKFKSGLELYMVAPIVSGITLPQTEKFISVASEASVNIVISSSLLVLPSSQMVAEKINAPFIQIQHVPMFHSDLFPPVLMKTELEAKIIDEIHIGKRNIETERKDKIIQSLQFLELHAKSLKIMFQSILDDINIIRKYTDLPELSSPQLAYIRGNSQASGATKNHLDSHVLLAMPNFMDVNESPRSPNSTRVGLLNAPSSLGGDIGIDFLNFIEQGPPLVVLNIDWNAPEEVRMEVAKEVLDGFASAGINRVCPV